MSLEISKSIDTVRSPVFLMHVRSMRCCICEHRGEKQRGRTQPHHTEPRGRSAGSDLLAVPVCQFHHPQSNKIFVVLLRENGTNIVSVIAYTQAHFCKEHGYSLDRFMEEEDPFEAMMLEAELAEKMDDSKRVSHGTAKSKGKKLSNLRPLSKRVGTPTNPLIQ